MYDKLENKNNLNKKYFVFNCQTRTKIPLNANIKNI